MRSLLLLAVLALALPSRAQPVWDFSAVDALMADSLDLIGGGAALLVIADGEIVHREGYGSFSPEAVRFTASAAKWYSGAVIASLVADGSLTLEDSLAQFFPSLTGPKRAITVRQLFSHTSGMLGSDDGNNAPCISQGTSTLEACAVAILEEPLASPPGTTFRYGGNSMQVAGRVAEIATGEAWGELFDARIGSPLGLRRTNYLSDSNPRIGAGMFSNVDDFAIFLQMMLNEGEHEGQQVLPPEAVSAMLADQTRGVPIAYSPYSNYEGYPGMPPAEDVRYGIGLWRERVTEDGTLHEASSPGGLGMVPWIDLERDIAGILVTQDVLSDVFGTYLEIKRLVREIADANPTTGAPTPPVSPRLDAPAPNPTRDTAHVRFTLPESGRTRLLLLDARGRRIAVLDRGFRARGSHSVEIDLSRLASGVYRVLLVSGGTRVHRPLIVAR